MRIETEALRKVMARQGLKGGAFDNDDVISNTNPLFSTAIDAGVQVLSLASGIDQQTVLAAFKGFNENAYVSHRVHPLRWKAVISGLRNKFPEITTDSGNRALEILMNIYNQTPELNEGAVETLEAMKTAGMKLVMVTHRYRPWHDKVMQAQGISGLFDEIKVAGSRRLKVAADWQHAVDSTRFKSDEFFGVEDRTAGLWEMHAIGIMSLWKVLGKWSFYANGDPPPGTHNIDGIKDLIPAFLEME